MKIRTLALIALLGGALMAFGCGDSSDGNGGDGGGAGGNGGDGGVGGDGGGGAGAGGTGGGTPEECNNAPACLFCPQDAFEGLIAQALPDGIFVPVEYTIGYNEAAAGGQVDTVLTGAVELDLSSFTETLGQELSINIKDGSEADFTVSEGGTGEYNVVIPAGTVETVEGQLRIDVDPTGGTITDLTGEPEDALVTAESVFVDLEVDLGASQLGLSLSAPGDCELYSDGAAVEFIDAVPTN